MGRNIVNLKCRFVGGKTGLFPTVWVVRVVWPVATVQFGVEPDLETTQQSGSVANAISLA